ncbi:MAG: TonB-dependent receptor [Gammaproteobacteria bacterium]|nr:TonB-dependent receptor [Gammaproteobacteria bacterium]
MTNIRVGYQGKNWQVNGFTDNVFDRKVEERYWEFFTSAYASTPVYLPGRTLDITFKYDL